MSLIQTLVNKVIQLNDRLNQIVLNARKIEDLPPQVEADFNSLIHVSRNGISEKLSLSVLQEAVSEGSVKPRLISVGYLGNPTYIELAAALNNRPTINILAGELPLFHFYDARARGEATVPNPSYRFFTNKKSPNTYGAGGIAIVPSNLIYVSQTNATVDEIESMQGTQIIDLGEIGTANVWDFLNLKDPIVSIQDATDGYRLVKTLVDGVSVRYLFLGLGGDYGVGGLQSVEGDFDIQSGGMPNSEDTIATKIDITLTDLGVTTIAEVTDAKVTAYINGLGLVKSRKEFYVVSVEDLRYIITDLPEGLVNITEDQLLENSGSGEPSVIFRDTKVFYTGSKSFTIEEGVKVLTFKKNGSTISIDWTQVGNIITYNGLEELNTEDYFIYNGIKAVSIVEVSGDVPDATTTIKGKLKLAGDLGGTADNPTVPALANIYTKTEVNAKLSAVYISKGSVNTYLDLLALTGQEIGWVWNVKSEGKNYAWVGVSADFPNGWDDIGGVFDVSGKEDKTNKTSDIEANKTSEEKYTSPKGVANYVDPKLLRKIESTLDSPNQIIKHWTGTFTEFKAIAAVGLSATTQYFYKVITQELRNPSSVTTFQLTKWDKNITQIIQASCTLAIPIDSVNFECDILVNKTVTFNITGGSNLKRILADGTEVSGDVSALPKGLYRLIQIGETLKFVLC